MKKRLFVCLLFGLTAIVAGAQSWEPSEQEISVLLAHYDELKARAHAARDEVFADFCLRYNVPKTSRQKLKQWLTIREERKAICNYLYPDSVIRRVKAKRAIDELYQDSIDIIMIPYNAYISGENLSYALKAVPALALDSAQYEYLRQQALDVAHQLRKNPRQDVWGQEMKVIENTLTIEQLNRFFILKNGALVSQKTRKAWNRLQEAGLTEELDSAAEYPRAFLYYSEQQKIMDLYKKNNNLRKKNLTELSRQMPLAVKMLDALEKQQKRNETRQQEVSKEYVW